MDLDVIKKSYTDPKRAAEFVEATGVDIFAGVFGNLHGTFPIEPELDFGLLLEIRRLKRKQRSLTRNKHRLRRSVILRPL